MQITDDIKVSVEHNVREHKPEEVTRQLLPLYAKRDQLSRADRAFVDEHLRAAGTQMAANNRIEPE